jgi:hypothetical protein
MGEHTEKILCDKCGEAVKVDAGKEFKDVHTCKPKTETKTTTSTSTTRSRSV